MIFWIRSVQNGSNLIKLDSSPIKKCFYKNLSNLQKGWKWLFCFWFFWIRSVQNGSNLIKLDFWWNNHWNISSDFQLYLFFDQIESDLSKMDQNGSNLIKLDFWWNNHWNISLDFLTLSIFWSDLIRSFQNCQLDQYNQICNFYQFYIFHLSIFFNQLYSLPYFLI